MKKLLFILFFIFSSLSLVLAQDVSIVNNNGQTVSTCDGTITIGSYTPGTTYTVTVCSNDALNRHIIATDGAQSFPAGTQLCVYDGDDATANQIVCWDNNSAGTVGAFASNTNESGCLTFVFTSTVAGASFTANLGCQFQCPAPLLVDIVASTPNMVNIDGVNYTNLCWDYATNQAQQVTFTAQGTYPSGVGYPLSDNNVTFTWNFNDGSPEQVGVGLSEVTHTFTEQSGYTIELIIEDAHGCFNTNAAVHRIRVAKTPLWSAAGIVDPQEICMGEEVQMCAAYGTSEWNSSIVPAIADTVSFPDGNGVCYESNLTQNQFRPSQTLENPEDLEAICMNLEHSFLGDITIDIQCPNGQSVQLQEQGGGSTHLGEPIDNGWNDNNEIPGVGYWYCITDDATQTLLEAATGLVPTLPAGDYASFEDLNGLVGCPLNGQWTITVCDWWGSDDGYIFGWYIDFDDSLFPEQWQYTPDYQPHEWHGMYGAALNAPTNDDCVTGTYMTTDNPGENSEQPFVFTLMDDFGCEHDTAMYVTVLHENDPTCCIQPTPNAGNTTTVCGLSHIMEASSPVAGNNGFWEVISGPGVATFIDATNAQTQVSVTVPGNYEFSWTEQFEGNAACETSVNITITFEKILNPIIAPIPDMCRNDSPFEIVAVDFGTITSNPAIPNIENGIIDPGLLTPGTTYVVTNTLPGTCYTAQSDTKSFVVFDEIQLINFNDQNCIAGNLYEVEFQVVGSDGGTFVNNYTVNNIDQTNANFYAQHPSQTSYNYNVQDINGCSSITVQGYRDCGCPSPGVMNSLEIVEICGNGCTGDFVGQGGDYHPEGLDYVKGYIIHQGDIDNPLGYNAVEPDFCRNTTPGLNYGEIYYVASVVSDDANSNNNGTADPSDLCYSAAQGTPVRWLEIPVPFAGEPNDTCGLVMPLNGSEVPAGMIGYWSSSCDFVAVGGTNYHDSDMIAYVNNFGDCVFEWHIVNGQCDGSDEVVMSFNPNPIPFAGNDTIVCGNQVELSVNNSIPGTIFQWSAPGATFNPIGGATTTATVNSPGTYQFTLTEFNGDCSAEDQIKVTFIATPQPDISSNVDTVCGTNTCLSVSNVNGEGMWTASAEGGINAYFDDATDPNTCVTVDNYSGNYRNVQFTWTEINQYQDIQCESSASRNIVFAKTPSAFVGNDNQDEVCGDTYTFHADTTATGWANTYWMVKEGISFTMDDASLPDATVTINPLSSYGDSAYVQVPFLWVASSGGGCFDIDTMWVTFYKEPIANAGLDDSICGLQYNLNAYYSLPDTSNYEAFGYWSDIPGENPGSVNFIDPNDPATLVNVGAPGVYQFVWRENNNNRPSCHTKDTVTIIFKEQPLIDAGDDFNVCGNVTTLNATTTGFDLSWQPVTGIVYDDYTVSNPQVTYGGYGEVTFPVGVSNGICTAMDEVTVHFWRKPSADHAIADDDTTICGRIFPRLRAENPGDGVVGNWISNPPNGVQFYENSYIDTMQVLNHGHYTVWWTESTGPDNEGPDFCTDTSEPHTIHFIEIPDALAGTDTVFCGYSGNMNAELSVSNQNSTGSWFAVSSNITFAEPNNPESEVTSEILTTNNPDYDNFELVWTENNFNCTSSDTVVVGFARIPEATLTIIPPRCNGETASIKAQEDSLQNYDWEFGYNYQIDSTWELNAQGGDYRHLVRWENNDTAHIVTLTVENYWGCLSPTVQDTIYEPYKPNFEVVTFPDTCALGRGGFEFIPDPTTEYPSFSWINLSGNEQPVSVGDTTFNFPAGTYNGLHQYRTYNNAYITQYIDLYGSEQCIDEFDFDIDTAGVVTAEFIISGATDMDALVAPNAEVIFDNLSDGDNVRTICTWYFGDGESTNSCDDQVSHVYTEPNDCYEPYLVVRVRNLPECRDTAFLDCITIDDMSKMEIPNIFTPNGDGMNDYFQVKAQTLQSFTGMIVNRWGRSIYEWTDYEMEEAGWNGKLAGGGDAASGVYYYVIKAIGMDGKEYDLYGPLHLIREK